MSAQSSRTSQTSSATTHGPPTTTVHLRPRPKKKAVQWTEEVVDNENMGKRSSKSTSKFSLQNIFVKHHFLTSPLQFAANMNPIMYGAMILPGVNPRLMTAMIVRLAIGLMGNLIPSFNFHPFTLNTIILISFPSAFADPFMFYLRLKP